MLTAKVAPERLVFLRTRMRDSHFDGADLRIRAQRRAIAPSGAQKEGQEYHAALEHAPLSLSLSGMGPSLAVEGATTARVFEAYVKKVLAPSLQEAGQVVIMDNLEAPTGPRA